jgi:hypothetical protein
MHGQSARRVTSRGMTPPRPQDRAGSVSRPTCSADTCSSWLTWLCVTGQRAPGQGKQGGWGANSATVHARPEAAARLAVGSCQASGVHPHPPTSVSSP